jgi:hypothetical protein
MKRYFWISPSAKFLCLFTSFCFTPQLFTTILILSVSPLNTSFVFLIRSICIHVISKTTVFKQFTYFSLLLIFLPHKFHYPLQRLNNLWFRGLLFFVRAQGICPRCTSACRLIVLP